MKLNLGTAWTDAVALLRGQTEILVVLAGTFLLLPALVQGFFMPFQQSGSRDLAVMVAELRAYFGQYGVWLILFGLISALGQVAILRILLDRARPTVAQALGDAVRLLPWFYLANIVTSAIVFLGMLAFVIPGLYILGRTALTGVAVAGEMRRNPIDAVRRSFELTNGNGWAMFFLVAIIFVTGFIVTAALGSVVGVIAALLSSPTLAAFITAFIDSLMGAVLGLLMLLIYVAAYRQLGGESGSAE
jgi:hypothetical protein